jgi:uncharacterized protein (DUF2267 family)
MSATGLEVFDRTLQITNTWLGELMDAMHWNDRHKAYHALRAVLHTLRDRLPVNVAVHLGAQLPMLVRGLYYEGWHPADKPLKERSRDEFVAHVTEAFLFDVEAEPERITRAVFRIMSKHITAGEAEKVKLVLPEPIRELWS